MPEFCQAKKVKALVWIAHSFKDVVDALPVIVPISLNVFVCLKERCAFVDFAS